MVPLPVGLVFAFLTWVMIGAHPYIGASGSGLEYVGAIMMIFLFPGTLASMAVSGNVHTFSIWVAVLENFVFYFGAVYLISPIREKIETRRRGIPGGET